MKSKMIKKKIKLISIFFILVLLFIALIFCGCVYFYDDFKIFFSWVKDKIMIFFKDYDKYCIFGNTEPLSNSNKNNLFYNRNNNEKSKISIRNPNQFSTKQQSNEVRNQMRFKSKNVKKFASDNEFEIYKNITSDDLYIWNLKDGKIYSTGDINRVISDKSSFNLDNHKKSISTNITQSEYILESKLNHSNLTSDNYLSKGIFSKNEYYTLDLIDTKYNFYDSKDLLYFYFMFYFNSISFRNSLKRATYENQRIMNILLETLENYEKNGYFIIEKANMQILHDEVKKCLYLKNILQYVFIEKFLYLHNIFNIKGCTEIYEIKFCFECNEKSIRRKDFNYIKLKTYKDMNNIQNFMDNLKFIDTNEISKYKGCMHSQYTCIEIFYKLGDYILFMISDENDSSNFNIQDSFKINENEYKLRSLIIGYNLNQAKLFKYINKKWWEQKNVNVSETNEENIFENAIYAYLLYDLV